MKSWRTLVAAGLAAGAAAVIFPMAASPAAAAEDWHLAGGGYPTLEACDADARDYLDDDYHDYTQHYCTKVGDTYHMYVR